jgi:ABC-type bacteriocin/lantibiotic exporter with double-glycine peptidase domain
MMSLGMDSNLSKFISEIWRYKPIIIILLVAGLAVFIFSVIDTHCYRKKNQKKRHRPKDH